MHTGFIGAGLMGHGMAACLLAADHELTVLAHRNRAPVEDLLARGAREASSAAQLAGSGAQVIFLCLPNSEVVESVVAQMEPALAAGSIVVDCTTALPTSTVALHGRLAQREVGYCDAPVTGGPEHAARGALTALVGADPGVFATVQPLIATFARKVLHMGGPGAGHCAKLLNNLVTNATSALLAEAYTVARELHVDWHKLHEAMTGGAARSGTLEKMVAPALAGNYSGHAFAIANAEKDVRYYCTLREAAGVATPLGRAVQRHLATLCAEGLGQRLFSELLDPHLREKQ